MKTEPLTGRALGPTTTLSRVGAALGLSSKAGRVHAGAYGEQANDLGRVSPSQTTGERQFRFGCFTLLSTSSAWPGQLAVANDDRPGDETWMLRMVEGADGRIATDGMPEILPLSADAVRIEDASMRRWLIIVFPASAVAPPTGFGRVLRSVDNMTGALIGTHVRELARLLPASAPCDRKVLADATQALLVACLWSAASDGSVDVDRTASTQQKRVERIIRENVSRTDLDAARIGDLAGLSRSTLYRLFSTHGGVAAYLRSLRLELIRADLSDPSLSGLSIAEIARRRGHTCASSFNRAFRKAYGRTPGAIRLEAGAPDLWGVNRAVAGALHGIACDRALAGRGP